MRLALEVIQEASLGPSSRLFLARFILLEALFLAFFLFFVDECRGSQGSLVEIGRGVGGAECSGEEGGLDSGEDWAMEDWGEPGLVAAGES